MDADEFQGLLALPPDSLSRLKTLEIRGDRSGFKNKKKPGKNAKLDLTHLSKLIWRSGSFDPWIWSLIEQGAPDLDDIVVEAEGSYWLRHGNPLPPAGFLALIQTFMFRTSVDSFETLCKLPMFRPEAVLQDEYEFGRNSPSVLEGEMAWNRDDWRQLVSRPSIKRIRLFWSESSCLLDGVPLNATGTVELSGMVCTLWKTEDRQDRRRQNSRAGFALGTARASL